MSSTSIHPPERLHGLDALRGIALILGVVLHASLSYLPPPPLTLETFPLLHLWFLWVLLLFYAVFLAVRLIGQRIDRDRSLVRKLDRLTNILIGPWTPAVLAAPLALALWLTPDWIVFFGIPTPDKGFVPNPAAVTGFGLAFTLGILLDRRRDLLSRIERLWPLFSLVAIGTGTGALMISGGPIPSLMPISDPSMKAFAAAVYAFAVFTATFAAISLSLRFLSGYSAVRRYLADASYWIYLIHLPLVMAGQVLMLEVALPWWGKLGAVALGVLTVSLISYELLVRHTFFGKALNGRRVPWRKPSVPHAVPAE